MKLGIVTGKGCNFMCAGPLCFHGFNYHDAVWVKKGEAGKAAYLCLEWGDMIPN